LLKGISKIRSIPCDDVTSMSGLTACTASTTRWARSVCWLSGTVIPSAVFPFCEIFPSFPSETVKTVS
jgi:hypothetical protein